MVRFGVEYTCDRCGHKELVDLGLMDDPCPDFSKIYDYRYAYPENWGPAHGSLLCPSCYELYLSHLDEFMKEEK